MYNEEDYISACLDSIITNTYPEDRLEILVVDGGSTDQTRAIVDEYARRFPFIRCLDNPRKIQAAALNIGLAEATGEYILRMDAHTRYEPDYIAACIERLQSTGAANVGGVQSAAGRTYLASAIAIALTSPFGVGDARFRYATKETWVESVYLGAWHRSTLEKLGGFSEEWAVNEDFELNHRLRKMGGRILVSPAIRCRYYVRTTLRSFIWQYFRYGFWRARTLLSYPDSFRWRILAPPLLVLGLCLSLAMGPIAPHLAWVIPILYAGANLVSSIIMSLKHGLKYIPVLPVVYAALHLSWGCGFLIGLIYWFLRSRRVSGTPGQS